MRICVKEKKEGRERMSERDRETDKDRRNRNVKEK